MFRILLTLALLLPAAAHAAGETPRYFIAVVNGAYNFTGGEAQLEESYKALEGMVKLAGAQGVRLTLLFSAQYALYIASAPERLAGLQAWKQAGHEVGAYHPGPGSSAWDGYSDLPADELSRLRKDRTASGKAPGHEEFFAALARLEPDIKSGCMADSSDPAFRRAAPRYEVCGRADKGGGTPGVNDFVVLRGTEGGKGLSVFHPSGKAGIDAAEKDFSGMSSGIYGIMFKSSPSEFGAFYVWLSFLRSVDPLGVKSRTVAAAVESGLLPEMKAAAGRTGNKKKKTAAKAVKKKSPLKTAAKPEKTSLDLPPAWPKETPPEREVPRLKPVRSFFGSVRRMMFGVPRGGAGQRGSCGDGICDAFERASGRCPRDCGN